MRDDPARGGRVGQLVGLQIAQKSHRLAGEITAAPNPDCARSAGAGQRWIGELTLERRRGSSVVASWTETRALDRSEAAVSMRYDAQYATPIGTTGSRAAEWRVTPSGTYLAVHTDGGDRWVRRETEEAEAKRIVTTAEGMLQSLLSAVGGWRRTPNGWQLGEQPLRCGPNEPTAAFVSRLAASATPTQAELVVDDTTRRLRARWLLSDQSTLSAEYEDRVVPLPGDVVDPPSDQLVPIERDRSLHQAQELLAKLAEAGLATVASQPTQAVNGDGEQPKSQ